MQEFKSFLAEVKPKYIITDRKRSKITTSEDAYKAMIPHYDHDTINYHEQAVVLYLNRANNTVGVQRLAIGGISGCVMDGKIVFAMALQTGASGIILSHNHPSGERNPSNADISLTKELTSFGKMINLNIMDHLIITDKGYVSFQEEGLLR